MTNIPTVVIVGADKGGVGKTTVTRALLAYFKSLGIEYRAFDTETPGGNLLRFHGDKTELVDLSKSDGQVRVFDTLSRSHITVIDIRAGLLSPMLETLRDIGFLEASREGKLKVVVLHVLGSTVASASEIKATGEIMAGSRHVLIKNHINDTSYLGWDATTLADVVEIAKLDEHAMEHVEAAGQPFDVFHEDAEKNSFVLRGKVRFWLKGVFEQFTKAKLGADL